MANKKFVVELSAEERGRLVDLISKGKASAKAILKAHILRTKLVSEGLDAVLARRKRSTPAITAGVTEMHGHGRPRTRSLLDSGLVDCLVMMHLSPWESGEVVPAAALMLPGTMRLTPRCGLAWVRQER